MTAYRSTYRTLLSLFAISLISTAVAAAEVKQGMITGIDGTKIVVTMRTEQMSFFVSSSTLVSLNGQPAKMTDLRLGDAATVMYVINDDVSPTVQRVDAWRPSSPGNPDPAPQPYGD